MLVLTETTGQELQLEDAALGSGGEATVHAVTGQAEVVAKLYRKPVPEHADKLAAMVAAPPTDLTAKKHVSIAWPMSRLLAPGADRRFLGYLMPRVHDTRLMYEIFNPRMRLQAAPTFHFAHLLRVARNLSAAVKALHDRGYVIGDVNESNILVNRTALVTLIDTDSFQVRSAEHVFRCRVGKPEYTPPELQRARFADVDRKPEHDLFGLAVLIFQLLMQGTHPFTGVYTGPGEPGAIPRWIESGWFPYAEDPALPVKPRPHAPPWKVLPPVVQELMMLCFQVGHTQPAVRPTAADWRSALDLAEAELIPCTANAQHNYPRVLTDGCPWCAMALLQGRDPFPTLGELRARAAKPESEVVMAQPAAVTPGVPLPEAIPVKPLATPVRATVRRGERRTDTVKPALPAGAPPLAGPAVAPLPVAVALSERRPRRFGGSAAWWQWLVGGGLAMLVVAAGIVVVFLILRAGLKRPGPPAVAVTSARQVPPADRFDWQPQELVAVLGEHRGRSWSYARSVVYTPDGKLFSGGSNGDVYQWDPATLDLRRVLPGPGLNTMGLAASRDSVLIAAAGPLNGRSVLVLDTITGTEKFSFKGSDSGGNSVGFSPDGKWLAVAGGYSKSVRLFDLQTGKFSFAIPGYRGAVSCVAFSSDSRTLAAGSMADGLDLGEVKLWDVETRTPKSRVRIRSLEDAGFVALAFAPDGKKLAIVSGKTRSDPLSILSGHIHLWDVDREEEILFKGGNAASGRGLAFAPDGSTIAWEMDREICLLDVEKREKRGRFLIAGTTDDTRLCLAYSPDSKTLAVGTGQTLHLLDAANGKERIALSGHTDRLLSLVVLADGQSVLTGSADGMARVWDFTAAKERFATGKRRADIVLAARVGSGGEVLFGYRDGEVRRWDPRTGDEVSLLAAGTSRPLAVSPGGRRVALALNGGDTPVRVQDFASGDKWDDSFSRREVNCAAFNPDGTTLAISYQVASPTNPQGEPRLRLWSAGQADRILQPVAELGDRVTSVALSGDGRLLAAGGINGGVRLWNPANFEQRASLKGHNGPISSLTFAPDSHLLVSADESGQVLLWDTSTFEKVREWKLPGGVFCTAFSDDGGYLVLGNGNGTAYVLRLTAAK